MEKLFNDSELYIKERPKQITEQQAEKLYKEIAEEIVKDGWSDDDVEDIIQDVSEINFKENGYEIAKSLESGRRLTTYNIDAMFVEFLDCLGHRKDSIHRQNVRDWASANNPQPKFAKGQKIRVKTALSYNMKSGQEFFVTGIKQEEAYYMIHENPEHNGGYVFDYEKLEANCEIIE